MENTNWFLLKEEEELRLLNAILDETGFSPVDTINLLEENADEGQLIRLFQWMEKYHLFTQILGTDSGERVEIKYYFMWKTCQIVRIVETSGERLLSVLGDKHDALDVEVAILRN